MGVKFRAMVYACVHMFLLAAVQSINNHCNMLNHIA